MTPRRWWTVKVAVAKKQYACADCPNPVHPGQEYERVNEYGEQRKLHRLCAESRRAVRGGARSYGVRCIGCQQWETECSCPE